MPKIRGHKPDLWTDENFVELSPYARLLWIGMWNYACDNGHLADKSKQIKMRVLPTDDVNCAELLREIEAQGLIARENGVITIPNFVKHQKPDKRYFQTCDLPHCERPNGDSKRETRSGPHVAPTSPPSGHTVGSWGPHVDGDGEVKGSDGDGEGETRAAGKPRKKPSIHLPANWTPTDEHHKRAADQGIDLAGQVARFKAHAETNDRRAANWNAAFTQWLLNVPEWQRGKTKQARPQLVNVHDLETPPSGLTDEQYLQWEHERRQERATR